MQYIYSETAVQSKNSVEMATFDTTAGASWSVQFSVQDMWALEGHGLKRDSEPLVFEMQYISFNHSRS